METNTQSDSFELIKIHDPVEKIGGYTKLIFFPIEFSRDLSPEWVELFTREYESLSQSRSEDIVFQPNSIPEFASDWDESNVPSSRVMFLTLNDKLGPKGRVEPDPCLAGEWIRKAVENANKAFEERAS